MSIPPARHIHQGRLDMQRSAEPAALSRQHHLASQQAERSQGEPCLHMIMPSPVHLTLLRCNRLCPFIVHDTEPLCAMHILARTCTAEHGRFTKLQLHTPSLT